MNPSPPCNLQLPTDTFIEVNNLAFRSTDGLLYGVFLDNNVVPPTNPPNPANTNFGIVRIDSQATVEMVGVNPPPDNGGIWPNVRLDAGDISQDGNLMFVNQGGGANNTTTFAIIDLRTSPPEVIARPMIVPAAGTNAADTVNDWAYNRIDGNLYGGNRVQGRVARLNVADFFDLNDNGDPTDDGVPPPVGDPWPTLPTTITREDFNVAGCAGDPPGDPRCDANELPRDTANAPSSAYGGSWLNASGTLFLYRNLCDNTGSGQSEDPCFECGDPSMAPPMSAPSTCCNPGDPDPSSSCPDPMDVDPMQTYPNNGKLFRIELNLDQTTDPTDLSPPAMPEIVRTRIGRDSEGFNDSASCIRFPRFGPAKQMTATCGLPSTVTIEYVFENFEPPPMTPDVEVSELSAPDDLTEVFGVAGVDWNFLSISSTGPGAQGPDLFHNPGFDGSSDPELISQAPLQALEAGETATITVVIEVLTLANADQGQLPDPPPLAGSFCNQIQVNGVNADGVNIGDLSTAGLDPDPDGNGDPDEALISCVTLATPAVTLDKTGAFDDGGDGPDAGDLINYTLTVSNPAGVGARRIDDLTITDPLLGATIDCAGDTTPPQIASLAPGAQVMCTGSYPITRGDIGSTVMNTATVSGTPFLPDPPFPPNFPDSCPPVGDTDDHSEDIEDVPPLLPCIDLSKSCATDLGGNGTADPGDLLDYELVVTNCGDVTLTNVFIDDAMVSVDCSPLTNGSITLAPAEVAVCTGTYAITPDDINAGEKCNVATATGDDPSGAPVTSPLAESCCQFPPGIEIPTLGQLGLLLLFLGLAGVGLRRIRRRR